MPACRHWGSAAHSVPQDVQRRRCSERLLTRIAAARRWPVSGSDRGALARVLLLQGVALARIAAARRWPVSGSARGALARMLLLLGVALAHIAAARRWRPVSGSARGALARVLLLQGVALAHIAARWRSVSPPPFVRACRTAFLSISPCFFGGTRMLAIARGGHGDTAPPRSV